MSHFAAQSLPTIGDGIDISTDHAQVTAALAYLSRHDAEDCAEALGLVPYVGHARTYRNGPSHAVARGPR